jgi:hypothetical protein
LNRIGEMKWLSPWQPVPRFRGPRRYARPTLHFAGTRVSLSLFGTEKGYAEALFKFWVLDPLAGILQAILLR